MSDDLQKNKAHNEYKAPGTKIGITISGLNTAMLPDSHGILKRVYKLDVIARIEGAPEAYDIHASIPFKNIPINATKRDKAEVRATVAMSLLETMFDRILSAEVERC